MVQYMKLLQSQVSEFGALSPEIPWNVATFLAFVRNFFSTEGAGKLVQMKFSVNEEPKLEWNVVGYIVFDVLRRFSLDLRRNKDLQSD